jgi:serine protease AprX
VELWHSNYGESNRKMPKPELVAPSIRVAAPLLPGSELAVRAGEWFARGDHESILSQKLITPHYQQVEGTSFAAPIVAGTIACMLEANPHLTPFEVRRILVSTATRLRDADDERQGAGALNAGAAVAAALAHMKASGYAQLKSPHVAGDRVLFIYRDPRAKRVQVRGEWDNWQSELDARQVEAGVWLVEIAKPGAGFYAYKFLIDQHTWIDDPENGQRRTNPYGEYDSILVVG